MPVINATMADGCLIIKLFTVWGRRCCLLFEYCWDTRWMRTVNCVLIAGALNWSWRPFSLPYDMGFNCQSKCVACYVCLILSQDFNCHSVIEPTRDRKAKIQFFILVHITHNLDTELWVITAFLLWPINKNRYLQLLSHQHQPCPSVYSCPEDKEYSVLCTAQTNKLQQVIKLEVKFLLRQYT